MEDDPPRVALAVPIVFSATARFRRSDFAQEARKGPAESDAGEDEQALGRRVGFGKESQTEQAQSATAG